MIIHYHNSNGCSGPCLDSWTFILCSRQFMNEKVKVSMKVWKGKYRWQLVFNVTCCMILAHKYDGSDTFMFHTKCISFNKIMLCKINIEKKSRMQKKSSTISYLFPLRLNHQHYLVFAFSCCTHTGFFSWIMFRYMLLFSVWACIY